MVLLFLRIKVICYSRKIFFHIFSIFCSISQNPRTVQAKHRWIPIIHLFHNDLCFIQCFIISFTNKCTALGTINFLQLNLFPLRVLRTFLVAPLLALLQLVACMDVQLHGNNQYSIIIIGNNFWKYQQFLISERFGYA